MDFTAFLNAIYDRLLLRDVFAKILPGSLLLFALSSMVTGRSVESLLVQLSGVSWPALVFVAGAAWILAFVSQFLWEWVQILPPWDNGPGREFWSRMIAERSTLRMRPFALQLERMATIKEAAGNLASSSIAAAAIFGSTRATVVKHEYGGASFGGSEWVVISVILVLLLTRCLFTMFREVAMHRLAQGYTSRELEPNTGRSV